MDWVLYFVLAIVLGAVVIISIALFLAIAFKPTRVTLGPVNQPPGNTPAGATTPPITPTVATTRTTAATTNWNWLAVSETWIIIVAVLFLGALLLRMYHTYDMDPARVWNEEPIWFYILGVALILFVLSRMSFGWVSTTFKPKAFGTQILISFLVLSAFFFMLSHVYPDAPLFNTEEGKRHIFWYYVLAGLAALVAANFEGKAWFVYVVLIGFMFWMQGHESKRLLGISGNLFARSAPLCPGTPPAQEERLDASGWTNIHHCDIGVAVAAGSPPILLVRPDGSTIRVVAGDYSLPPVVPVIFAGARPEGKEARWFHIECEPGKWIPGTWRCRS